jgi:hypothetical protein
MGERLESGVPELTKFRKPLISAADDDHRAHF